MVTALLGNWPLNTSRTNTRKATMGVRRFLCGRRCDRFYETSRYTLSHNNRGGAISLLSVQRCYYEDIWGDLCKTRVEAGSNTSTVTLRVVGGDEMGSLKSETVKYGREYQGTRTQERMGWQGPAANTKDRPVLSSKRAPHGNKNVTVRQK
jgi:hypothetical protein